MKLGGLTLDKAPVVCGVVVKSFNFTSINKALRAGAGMLEVRLDTFSTSNINDIEGPLKRLKTRKIPLLLTIRNKKEGGKGRLSDAERLALFNKLLPLVDAVDIELSSKKILKETIKAAKAKKKRVIVSFHDFKATPTETELEKTIKEAKKAGAEIVKIAAKTKTTAELARLAGLLAENKDLIVIAMGRRGSASRVFFPMLGSLITYSGISGTNAPGQLSITELKREFKKFGY